MIQFNLLPDVKLEFIKTRRLKRLVIVISSIIAGASLALLVFMLVLVYVIQKTSIKHLSATITSDSHKVTSTPNLNKILTVQNQLASLPALNGQKPVTSRVFNYVTQLTPASVTISDLNLDFSGDALKISGSADSLATVNTLVDTYKFTTYSTGSSSSSSLPAFSNVVLSSFALQSGATSGNSTAQYSISANFSPAIFSEANSATLTVPNEITTRSQLDQATPIFKSNTQ
jgi:hypothetical protein